MSEIMIAQATAPSSSMSGVPKENIFVALVNQLRNGKLAERISAAKDIQNLYPKLTEGQKAVLGPNARDAFIYLLDQKYGVYGDQALRSECIKALAMIGDSISVARIVRVTRRFGPFGRDEAPAVIKAAIDALFKLCINIATTNTAREELKWIRTQFGPGKIDYPEHLRKYASFRLVALSISDHADMKKKGELFAPLPVGDGRWISSRDLDPVRISSRLEKTFEEALKKDNFSMYADPYRGKGLSQAQLDVILAALFVTGRLSLPLEYYLDPAARFDYRKLITEALSVLRKDHDLATAGLIGGYDGRVFDLALYQKLLEEVNKVAGK